MHYSSSTMRSLVLLIALSSALVSNQASLSAAMPQAGAPAAPYSKMQKAQLATALARLIALTDLHPNPKSQGAALLRILKSVVRITNQIISIYNSNDYTESYSAYVPFSYDFFNLGNDVAQLLNKTSVEKDVVENVDTLVHLKKTCRVLFPIIETCTAYKLVGNSDKQSRRQLQAILSLSRSLAELIDSEYGNIKSKTMAALLLANIGTAYLDVYHRPAAEKNQAANALAAQQAADLAAQQLIAQQAAADLLAQQQAQQAADALAAQQAAAQARQTLNVRNPNLTRAALNIHARIQIDQRGLLEGTPEHNAIIAARDHLIGLLPQ